MNGIGSSTSGDGGLVDGDRVGNSTEAEKCEDTGGGFSRSPDQSGTKAQTASEREWRSIKSESTTEGKSNRV